MEGNIPISALATHLRTLIYACLLIKLTRPHIANPLIYCTKQRKYRRSPHMLKARRISVNEMNNKLESALNCELDINALVLVSPIQSLTLELYGGQWYEAIFHCEGEGGKWNRDYGDMKSGWKRWIRVVVCPDVENECCLMSPVLYHNVQQNDNGENVQVLVGFLSNGLSELSEPVRRVVTLWDNIQGSGIPVKGEDFNTSPHLPQTASEVHVKAIESAKYRCGVEIESLLKDYFRVPKIVAEGDVIVLPVPSHIAYDFTPGNSLIPPKYVFIKVTKVKGTSERETRQCVQVTARATDLYLLGTTHCLLPVISENFDGKGEVDIPPLLKETISKVKAILQTELLERKQKVPPLVSATANHVPSTPKGIRRQRSRVKVSDNVAQAKVSNKPREKGDKSPLSPKYKHNITTTATILLLGPPGSGKKEVIRLTASSLGLGVVWANCWMLKGDTSGGTEARLRQTFVRASAQGPCILALLNVHCISKNREGQEDVRVVSTLREEVVKLSQLEPRVFLLATAPDRKSVSDDLWSVWSHQERVGAPDPAQRGAMLTWLLSHTSDRLTPTERSHMLDRPQIQPLAQRTAGYTLGDFEALLHAAQRQCLLRVCETERERTEVFPSRQLTLTHTDLLNALDELQGSRSDALGAPRIPQVRWGEVGGLEEAKREIVNTIQLPLKHPALVSSKLRRSGVLLYGPPGTGKTLLAKAVATECGLNFMSVKGPELLNMYVGQSEENVRQAEPGQLLRCVIFFDELDSLAPNRGRSGDSGGVMDRIVSALLAELDGVSSGADVFVLAATNRPDLLDPALLRPGRFEKLVFLGVCEDREGQVKILKAVTSKMPLASSVSLHRIAELLPLTLTGADLHALCSDALYSAIRRAIDQIDRREREGKVADEAEEEFEVEERDFEKAVKNLVPSVSPRELAHYKSLEKQTQR